MQVRVKVFATLRRYIGTPGGEAIKVELPEGATLADVTRALELPADQVKVVFVNGRARAEDWPLSPGDEIGIFPPIGGG